MSFETYIQDLVDPTKPLSVSGLERLSGLGPEEMSLLTDAWPELELSRRQRVVSELTDLAEDDIELNFDAVFLLALTDRDPEVRRTAIQGLWEYEGRDLIDPLVNILERDPDAGVRAEAALVLGRFVVAFEFDTLGRADAERVDQALDRVIEDETEVAEVRGRALEALGARSEEWVRDTIEKAFDSPERRLRLSAVHAMGRSCDAAWLPTVLPELENDDPEMRYEAAGACGAIADDEATPHLVGLLDDEDAEVQEAAITALGEIASGRAKETLESVVEQGGERAREAALEALAAADFEDDPLGFKVRG